MKKGRIRSISKKITSAVMLSGPYEWPPSCLLFAYQPVRPEQKPAQCQNLGASETKEEK